MSSARGMRRRATLSVVGVTAIWGVTFPLNDLALGSVTPVELTLWRFVLAAAVLCASALRRRVAWRRSSLGAGIASGLALWAGYLTQVEGQRYVAPAIAGFLTGLSVVVVPLLVVAVGRRPSRRQLAGVALAGIALVVLSRPHGHAEVLGIALEGACAVFFAAQIVILEQMGDAGDSLATAAIQMGTIAVASLLVAPVLGSPIVPLHASAAALVAIAYDGLAASALAFVVQAWALAHADSVEISVVYGAEPVFAAVASLAFGFGGLGARVVVGGLAAVAAILLASVPPGGLQRRRIA